MVFMVVGLAVLEAGELGMLLEPLLPAGEQGVAGALSGEDAVQVAAMDSEVLRGERGSGETGFEGLVGDGHWFGNP
jgi:hypothetical protein